MLPPEERGQITLRTIAQAVGVSHVTVSLALRNNPEISLARRQQIQAVAQEMGYRPNAMAVSLAHHKRTATTTPIKAVLAWLNQWNPPQKLRSYREFDYYWQGASSAAEKFGYRLEEFRCGGKMPLSRIEKILLTRGIHGVLLPPHPQATKWDTLRWERFSAMRFGRSVQNPRLHIVTSDQVANTMLAFQRIQEKGYKRIGFVTPAGSYDYGALFAAGYVMAQTKQNCQARLPLCWLDKTNLAAGRKQLSLWMKANRPDAILTDLPETRALLKDIGCRVPEDVGLAALSILDGEADAGIDQHPAEIGRVAVLLVMSLINDSALGIPPIFRQSLVEGSWVDGSTLPDKT